MLVHGTAGGELVAHIQNDGSACHSHVEKAKCHVECHQGCVPLDGTVATGDSFEDGLAVHATEVASVQKANHNANSLQVKIEEYRRRGTPLRALRLVFMKGDLDGVIRA